MGPLIVPPNSLVLTNDADFRQVAGLPVTVLSELVAP